jgi:hypothetical protein
MPTPTVTLTPGYGWAQRCRICKECRRQVVPGVFAD